MYLRFCFKHLNSIKGPEVDYEKYFQTKVCIFLTSSIMRSRWQRGRIGSSVSPVANNWLHIDWSSLSLAGMVMVNGSFGIIGKMPRLENQEEQTRSVNFSWSWGNFTKLPSKQSRTKKAEIFWLDQDLTWELYGNSHISQYTDWHSRLSISLLICPDWLRYASITSKGGERLATCEI